MTKRKGYKYFTSLKGDKNHDLFIAKELASFDFDFFSIRDILCLYEYDEETSSNIANQVLEQLPVGFPFNDPPTCFADVRDYVSEMLVSLDIELFNSYFTKYTDNRYKDLKNRIIKMRESIDNDFLEELITDLKSLIEGLIIDNYALAVNIPDKDRADEIIEKEDLELLLFGVWSIRIIVNRQRLIEVDKKIMRKSMGIR